MEGLVENVGNRSFEVGALVAERDPSANAVTLALVVSARLALLVALMAAVHRGVRFARLVHAMSALPRLPAERFVFSLAFDTVRLVKKYGLNKRTLTKAGQRHSTVAADVVASGRLLEATALGKPVTRLPPSKMYPRMAFKLFDAILPEAYSLPIVGFFYGPIAFVSALTPEATEAILSTPDNLGKSFTFHFLRPWLGYGLLSNPGTTTWKLHRKMLTPALHFRVLENYRDAMNECALRLIDNLHQKTGNPFDALPVMRQATFAILFETAMGIRLDEKDPQHTRFLHDCDELADTILARMVTVKHWPDLLFGLTASSRKMRAASDRISAYIYQVIDARLTAKKKLFANEPALGGVDSSVKGDAREQKNSFMDIILDMLQQGLLTRREVRDHVATFIVGGFDTTATSLSYTLHLLGNHPDILRALQQEVDHVVGDGRHITKDHVGQLVCLDAVIKESMRLFPPLPLIARDITHPLRIGSWRVPAGAVGLVHIYQLHRNPHVWPEPNCFRPDRWLPEQTAVDCPSLLPTGGRAVSKKRHPYAFVPFSAGPRNCIGQKFAQQEDKIMLAHIVRNFNVIALQTTEELRLSIELILRPLDGLLVKLEPRSRWVDGSQPV